MKIYNASSNETSQHPPIFIYGSTIYTPRIPYRRFTINDVYQLAYQDLIDIDNVDELEALYGQNMAELPNDEFILIDDTNDTEIMCVLAALENKR